MSILNLPAPLPMAGSLVGGPTVTPPAPPAGEPYFKQSLLDRQTDIRIDNLTGETIRAALRQSTLGYMRRQADVEDLMYASNPILAGILDQRAAGLNGIEKEIQPADDSPEAAKYADEFRAEIARPESSWALFERSCTFLKIMGGGLIEPLWKQDVDGWHLAGFVPTPRQRTRFNYQTGEIGFAYNPFDLQGFGVSLFPPGTFIAITPDERIMDFGKRGAMRSVITGWFGCTNVGGWWQQDLERWNSPIIDFASDNAADITIAKAEGPSLGANGVIIHSKQTDVKPLEKGRQSAVGAPQKEFEDSRQRHWAIRFLGAEQTVAVSQGDGSQASVGTHADIRKDIIMGDAELVEFVGRRDVAVPWVVRNYGPAAASKAPIVRYEFDEPVDVGVEAANIDAELGLGLDMTEDEAYARIGRTKPAAGTRTMLQARKERQAEVAAQMAVQTNAQDGQPGEKKSGSSGAGGELKQFPGGKPK